jgi:NADPH:quinone reductase-like Zn-dependent oxidoreductase
MAKAMGCTVIATAGSDAKCAQAKALGADHVVNYTDDRFESVARKVTKKRGVDVVFEHVGATTWAGSLLSLKMGGRLVTCGSTSGVSAETNLMMIFQRQLHIFGSFGASMRNIADGLAKMAAGLTPVLDTVTPLEGFADALQRLESRQVFGKLVVTL